MATLALSYTIISNPAAVDGGVDHTVATKINNNAEVVGYYKLPDDSVRGFYLNNGAFADIVAPGATETEVFGLNDQGYLVGMTLDFGAPFGSFISFQGGFIDITIPDADLVAAQDINNSGEVVGVFSDSSGTHGFIIDGGGLTQLDHPDADPLGSGTVAFGVNDAGQVVGVFEDVDGQHSFLYDGGTYTALDVPGAVLTFVQDINEWGQISGFYVDNNGATHGFVFADGNYFSIEAPGGVGAIPGTVQVTGINDLGQVVGTYATDGGFGSQGFAATLGETFTYDVTFFDHPDAVPSASPPPASFGTEIRNSNIQGDFVGRYSSSSGPGFTGQSFASIGGTVFDLAFIEATGGVGATDINDLGQIAGVYFVAEDSSFHGFVYDGTDYVTLDSTLGDVGTTEILGMNNAGHLVGTYMDGGAEHAFIFDAGVFTELDLTGAGAVGNDIVALDINDFGQVVGTYLDIGTGILHGFLLSNGVFTTIAHPDAAGFGGGGVSINNAGQIAGFYMDAGGVVHPFVYSGGVYSTVDMPNSGGAYGISNIGTVVGSDNDGTTHHGFFAGTSTVTFVPTLPPAEPKSIWARAVDGSFEDATRWDPAAVPGATDNVVIHRPGTFTVTQTSDHVINKLVVGTDFEDQQTLRVLDATLQVDGGLIRVPGTLKLDSNSAEGASLLIGDNTIIRGGCGCEPDIQMGMSSPVGPIAIGTAAGLSAAVRMINDSAYIAGNGTIGDAMMKFENRAIVEASDGTLVLDTGANIIVNWGSLGAGPDATLDIDSVLLNNFEVRAFNEGADGGTVNLNAVVKNLGGILAEDGSTINFGDTLKNYNSVVSEGTMTATGFVYNDAAGSIDAIGGTIGITGDVNNIGGLIEAALGGSIDITGNVINKGDITASDSGSVSIHGILNNANVGALTADDGLILVDQVRNFGDANIVDTGTIHFTGFSNADVNFSGGDGGTLILDDVTQFRGDITGFDDTDMIELRSLLIGGTTRLVYNESQDVLRVLENNVAVAKLTFAEDHTLDDFELVDDGTGHVAIQHVEPAIII